MNILLNVFGRLAMMVDLTSHNLLYLSSKVVVAAELTTTCTFFESSKAKSLLIPSPSVEIVPLTAVSFFVMNSS